MLAGDGFFSLAGHLDLVSAVFGRDKRAAAVEESNLVLFEQVQDTIVVLLHDSVFAGQHLGYVHLHAGGGDAVLGEVMVGVVKMLAGLQQGLGGNAADVGASAAGCGATGRVFPLVDTGHVEAQLGRTNGRDIAAWAAADDDDVKIFAHVWLST